MKKNLFDSVCNETIFAAIHKSVAKDLHDFIYYKYGERFNPKDKVQEAFLKLWENCGKIVPEKAKSFLFSVANNTTLNEIKHEKVKLKYAQSTNEGINNENPQFLLEESEYLKKYQDALSKLTEEKRVAFLLNRVEGKKHKEIAEILNISKKAVEKRIYSALNELRKDIEGI
jgi:RNA polymerase sigma factor (sigma-70 family)